MFKLSLCASLTLVLLAALFLGGCAASKPSRFYTLSAMADRGEVSASAKYAAPRTIAIGPMQLPDYLNRPQIATRSGPNRVEFAEFERWGGGLSDEFLRTLAENLMRLMPATRVVRHSWRRSASINYQIPIEVIRFDGQLGGRVELVVQWQLLVDGGDTPLLSKRSTFGQAVGGEDYHHLVAAQSRALADFALEIVDAVGEARQNAHQP